MSKKIALVDDSSPFVLLVRQLLETVNCEVDGFGTAEEFFVRPAEIPQYDLIILDIHLPEQNGLNALELLKADPLTRSIPVLLLSGDSRAKNVVEGAQKGAQDFLTKPIDPQELIARVIGMLKDK